MTETIDTAIDPIRAPYEALLAEVDLEKTGENKRRQWGEKELQFIKHFITEQEAKKKRKSQIFRECAGLLGDRSTQSIQFLYYDRLKAEIEADMSPSNIDAEKEEVPSSLQEAVSWAQSAKSLGLQDISHAFETLVTLAKTSAKTTLLQQENNLLKKEIEKREDRLHSVEKERDLYKEKFEKITDVILSFNYQR